MTRWLQAAKRQAAPRTKPTELTKASERLGEGGVVALGETVLSDSSVLSEGGTRTPEEANRADGLEPDAGAYLDRLHTHGPATYGAMATALGWGATRAWRAEAKLRALGLIRIGEFGRGQPQDNPQLAK